MRWSLKQLREDVKQVFGSDQERLLAPCLQSVDERRAFARYHHAETRRLLETVTTDRTQFEMVAWMLDSESPETTGFQSVRFHASAHVHACVQSMHALADILGHAVYYGLGMNLDPNIKLDARSVNMRTVRDRLPAGAIRDHLTQLVDDAGFKYLAALVNHSKHRSLIAIPFSVDLSGEDAQPHGLKFGRFEFDGVNYPEQWVTPALRQEYDRQDPHILGAGIALNAAVAALR